MIQSCIVASKIKNYFTSKKLNSNFFCNEKFFYTTSKTYVHLTTIYFSKIVFHKNFSDNTYKSKSILQVKQITNLTVCHKRNVNVFYLCGLS